MCKPGLWELQVTLGALQPPERTYPFWTCRHCPGVSLHMTPYPVFKNLTIPSANHIISCMERESICLTCATLHFPAKYCWNLKSSLRCFHAICPQVKILISIKWKKHLWYWNTGPPPELHHRTGRVLQTVQGQPVHLLVYGAHLMGLKRAQSGSLRGSFHSHIHTYPYTHHLANWPQTQRAITIEADS